MLAIKTIKIKLRSQDHAKEAGTDLQDCQLVIPAYSCHSRSPLSGIHLLI